MHRPETQILTSKKTLDHGSKAVSTSAVQITATSTTVRLGVLVKAGNSNTGIVYIGNSDVTANTVEATDGFQLGAGESLLVEIDDPSKVYAIGSGAGQKVFWIIV